MAIGSGFPSILEAISRVVVGGCYTQFPCHGRPNRPHPPAGKNKGPQPHITHASTGLFGLVLTGGGGHNGADGTFFAMHF